MNYSYAATDHKLSNSGTDARSFDANGNSTLVPGTGTLAYDERNRLKTVVDTSSTRSASYNARGERVGTAGAPLGGGSGEGSASAKSIGGGCIGNGSASRFIYSESGALLGNYDLCAATDEDVVYLDSTPIARVKDGVVFPLEADHLGSPRVLQDAAGSSAVWSWNLLSNSTTGSNAFGEQAPTGSVTDFNLRFPGQYSDGNGLSYNYFRDYESGTGRYVESDPIGLRGGINTFGYVYASPLIMFDDEGTEAKSGDKCTKSPDFPGGWNFRKCCAGHDNCYGCPGKENGTDRPTCDTCFCTCLSDLCKNDPMPGPARPFTSGPRGSAVPNACMSDNCRRKRCSETASGYCWAVKKYGESHFQKDNCS